MASIVAHARAAAIQGAPSASAPHLGLLGAGVMARVLRSLVADTDVLDARLFTMAAALMVLTAGVAAWLPARRVLRIDPADSLRAE